VFADGRQALGGLSLALMALMLALAANIGVGTMVGSFRGTFEGWLDQRLAAEVYVRTQSEDLARAFEARAPAIPGVEAVLPSRSAEITLGGMPTEVLGLLDHPTYRRAWPLIGAIEAPWATVEAGRGALLSEQLARRLRARPGDRLILPGDAAPWPVTVAGIYPDYGNPQGQVVVNHAAHLDHFGRSRRGSWGVRVAEGRTQAVIERLRADPELGGLDIIDQQGIKALSLSIFERTFAVTGALNALTFGVAGVALLTSLATLAAMRLTQLAPLWAMGLTRRQLARIELGRTVGLAALTAVCALPLGLALAWVLLAIVNVQAFGWRLPMDLFPLDWLRLMLLALVAAALAAAWPAWRLARMAPARLVQVFAQER
jgi:putative ABC transport system permease protein